MSNSIPTTTANTTVAGVQCPLCEEKIWSRHRHDFRFCKCGYCFVDGGRDYMRTGYGIPYPHNGTEQEQTLARLATKKIGSATEIEIEVPYVAPPSAESLAAYQYEVFSQLLIDKYLTDREPVGRAGKKHPKKSEAGMQGAVPRVPRKTGKKR